MAKTIPTRKAAAPPERFAPADVLDPAPVGSPMGPLVTENERALTTQDGVTIQAFLKGLVPFFTQAAALEVQARTALAVAKSFTVPTTAEADLALQTFCKEQQAASKAIKEHWTITSVVFQFQRRLTAGRDRADKMAGEARDIANRLHNTYVENERRRVAQEEDRRRREAEAQARADREAESARLEAEALKLEEASADLSEREQNFVGLYVVTADAEQAARSAGYKDPFKAAARLLSLPKVQAAVEAQRQARAIREQKVYVEQAPLDVQYEHAEANILSGGVDRDTWSAEVFDEAAFMAALLDPLQRTRYGIPAACATFAQKELNVCVRTLHEQMNRWPGVRAKKTTKLV